MSVFTYSRTSICQDVAGLVNKVAVFVVLDGGRSWALHMGRWNRYQRRVPTEDPISGVECTVWLVRITLVGPTISPSVFGFMTKSPDREPISPAVVTLIDDSPVDWTREDVVVVVRTLIGCVWSMAATRKSAKLSVIVDVAG